MEKDKNSRAASSEKYPSRYQIQSLRQEQVSDDNFSNFSLKPYVVTPHLNRLIETVKMMGHNICFYDEKTKIYPNHHQKICSSEIYCLDVVLQGLIHNPLGSK